MQDDSFYELDKAYGAATVAKLAAAYEAALLAASTGRLGHVIDRQVRLAIVRSLIAEARDGRLEAEHLTRVAMSAVVPDAVL